MLLLVSELSRVVDWFHLGLYLGLPPHELDAIRTDSLGQTKDCRSAVLIGWMRNAEQPKWSAIVAALVGIGMKVLAQKIAIKYGMNNHLYYFYVCSPRALCHSLLLP